MHRVTTVFTLTGLLVAITLSATAEDGDKWRFEDGRWRTEVMGSIALDSGSADRDGDYYFTANVEYEWPVLARMTLGLRFYPLFLYHEKRDLGGDSSNIYGVAFGLTSRVYRNAEERDGWFFEVGASAMYFTDKISENDSHVEFLTQGGIGYKFPNSHWHCTLAIQHISNAGLGSPNRGVNALGLGVGYTF